MSRRFTFATYFVAIFLQAGAYGLTFMLPKLFDSFGANEKTVGVMLLITTVSTLITTYFSGHLSDLFGRLITLGLACLAIAASLFLFGIAKAVGAPLVIASILLGCGWGLTYSLGPIVLTRLVAAKERVSFFALLSIFVMAGFGFAPVLASKVQSLGYSVQTAFFINAALCIVSALLFFILNKPVKSHALNPAPEASSRLTIATTIEVLRSPARTPVVMVFLGASVFAGMNNFQTVFAEARGLDYANFFLTYTITVIAFRVLLVRFSGGKNPYLTIALLQYLMAASILLFIASGGNTPLYLTVAALFGLGYGASYPIVVAAAANDAEDHLGPQTLQLFALAYFVGIFGFPLIAGWILVDIGATHVLSLAAILAVLEASMALRRAIAR